MMNRLQALGVAYGAVAHEFEVMSDRLVGSSDWNELRDTLHVLREMIDELKDEDKFDSAEVYKNTKTGVLHLG